MQPVLIRARITPEEWTAIRKLALDRDTAVADLVADALRRALLKGDHGSLYIGTLNAEECGQFEQAAARQGVSVREALDSLARDYAQLHAPHSVKA